MFGSTHRKTLPRRNNNNHKRPSVTNICIILCIAAYTTTFISIFFHLGNHHPPSSTTTHNHNRPSSPVDPSIDRHERDPVVDDENEEEEEAKRLRLLEEEIQRYRRKNDNEGQQQLPPQHKPKPPITTATDAIPPPKAKAKAKATIGYAISITGCPSSSSPSPTLIDGAAVLRHSIHLNSIQSPLSSSPSQYDYKMYAIVHPSATECSQPLQTLGYNLLIRSEPVPLHEIQGDFLREKLPNNGCCGEKEFIKLWAYTLTDHPIVVHLDVDTMVLQPMDHLFDAMLEPPPPPSSQTTLTKTNLNAMWPTRPLPTPITAYFTRDYNMIQPRKASYAGVQGGFLILTPSLSSFQTLSTTIRTGDFRKGSGWGGTGHGTFYGGMTFQGIIPYFYDVLNPNTAVELNRCVWNAMADNPRTGRTVNDVVSGDCRDGRVDCEDCRETDVSHVGTAHFTLCQKPWDCLSHGVDAIQHRLCRRLHGEWFRVRADLEGRWRGGEVVVGEGGYDREHFRGFCGGSGAKGYIPIELADVVL